MALVFAAVGCVKQETPAPDNQPASAPEPAPAQAAEEEGPDWQDWMDERPFRQRMRLMWIDCGVIIGNSYHPEIADPDILRYSADSLAQKAERFATHFRNLRDANRDSAMAAKRGDWEVAEARNEDAHQTCGNCHYEFWPLSARAFVKDTMKGWHESRDVFGDEPWGGQVFTAPNTVLAGMLRMRSAMSASSEAIFEKDTGAFLRETGRVHKFAEKNLQTWDGIVRHAKAIAQLARESKLEEVGSHYRKLTQYCRDCHKESSDGRGVDPLPWPQE